MLRVFLPAIAALAVLILPGHQDQEPKDLTVKTHIDSTYAFAFDLRESRSAKGGIWNMKTGRPETPLNYTQVRNDTIDGRPVIMLYREVVPGNHPLNLWEAWILDGSQWVRADEAGSREGL